MATTSTIPNVSDALVALIRVALPTVQVTDGRPADKDIRGRELVYLGDTTGNYELPVMKVGRRIRSEEYDQDIVFWVQSPRGDLGAAKRRGVELMNAACDVLANDSTLGAIDGVLVASAARFTVSHEYLQEGPAVLVTLAVAVTARLR